MNTNQIIKQYNQAGIIINSKEQLDTIMSLKLTYKCQKEVTTYLYKDAIKSYENIVNKTIILLNKLKLKDPLEISIFISYLLYNGFFSKNSQYHYNINPTKTSKIDGHYGMSIMDQEGVCLNTVYLTNDILQKMNHYSQPITVNIMKKELNYKLPVKRRIKHEELNKLKTKISTTKNTFNKNASNHICIIINNSYGYLVYDPTNLCIFTMNKSKKLNILNGTSHTIIRPYNTLIMDDTPNICDILEKLKQIINKYETIKDAKTMEKDMLQLFKKLLLTYKKNQLLIRSFHQKIENDITNISSIINKKTSFLEKRELFDSLYLWYLATPYSKFYYQDIKSKQKVKKA